jgi:hypothetical protein
VWTSVGNGAAIPAKLAGNKFLQAFKREMHVLRWFAVTMRPSLYLNLLEESHHWPEMSCLHYLWTPIEDWCLEAACTYAMRHNPTHLSLHFDGFRVAGALPDAENFRDGIESTIYEVTGYVVNFVRKHHRTLLDSIPMVGVSSGAMLFLHTDLFSDGNCLPFALAVLTGNPQACIDRANEKPADVSNVRRMRDFDGVNNAFLHPSVTIPTENGSYVLVSWAKTKLHATPMRIDLEGDVVLTLRHGQTDSTCEWRISHADFAAIINNSVDCKLIVFFKIAPTECAKTEELSSLLELKVGAGAAVGSGDLDALPVRVPEERKPPRGRDTYDELDDSLHISGDLLSNLEDEVKNAQPLRVVDEGACRWGSHHLIFVVAGYIALELERPPHTASVHWLSVSG